MNSTYVNWAQCTTCLMRRPDQRLTAGVCNDGWCERLAAEQKKTAALRAEPKKKARRAKR